MGRLIVQHCDGDRVELSTASTAPSPTHNLGCHFSVSARLGPLLAQLDVDLCELSVSLNELVPGDAYRHGQILAVGNPAIGPSLPALHFNLNTLPYHHPRSAASHYHGSQRQKQFRFSEPNAEASQEAFVKTRTFCLLQEHGRRLSAILSIDGLCLRSEPIKGDTDIKSGVGFPDQIFEPFDADERTTPWLQQHIGVGLTDSALAQPFICVRVSTSTNQKLDKHICLETKRLVRGLQSQSSIFRSRSHFEEFAAYWGADQVSVVQDQEKFWFLAWRSVSRQDPPSYDEATGGLDGSELANSSNYMLRSLEKLKSNPDFNENSFVRSSLQYEPYNDELDVWLHEHPFELEHRTLFEMPLTIVSPKQLRELYGARPSKPCKTKHQ
ncbi:hypothetical protein PYCC9005_000662 [Savitreella phatthalungensis]